MTTTTSQRAAIYARISLDKQEEAGVKRQIHLATKHAEADEAKVVATYVDNNISAFSGDPRPDYNKLIHAIENREIDVVYVYALDRLTRPPKTHWRSLSCARSTTSPSKRTVATTLTLQTLHRGSLS